MERYIITIPVLCFLLGMVVAAMFPGTNKQHFKEYETNKSLSGNNTGLIKQQVII